MQKILLTFFIIISISSAVNADKKPKIDVGDVPPDYVGKTLKGEKVYLSDHKGKIIVVTFWATWCPPCLKEIPEMNALQAQVSSDEFFVVGVNFKQGKRSVKKLVQALENQHMQFTVDKRGGIGRKYGVNSLPHMFVIGTDGKVVATHLGYSNASMDDIVEELNDLLQKSRNAKVAVNASSEATE